MNFYAGGGDDKSHKSSPNTMSTDTSLRELPSPASFQRASTHQSLLARFSHSLFTTRGRAQLCKRLRRVCRRCSGVKICAALTFTALSVYAVMYFSAHYHNKLTLETAGISVAEENLELEENALKAAKQVELPQRVLNETNPSILRFSDKSSVAWSDADHMHGGYVGLKSDGTAHWIPTPLTPLDDNEKRLAHQGYCFNTRVSDSLSLDRQIPDYNSPVCAVKEQSFAQNLPPATVVIVFHNENLSVLLRSIHSVLNRSPPQLLKDIIVVDDNSNKETHPWLFEQLDEHIKLVPKTKVRRLETRHGLMMARMRGVDWATGDAIVFLDSHIECAKDWLPHLLQPIFEDEKAVPMPLIHTIEFDNFAFQPNYLAAIGTTWSLGQSFLSERMKNKYDNFASPAMAGGLFAISKKWLLELGGYDEEMRLYGGEEMEISFKVWQCGGHIAVVPCSRVGHVFRSAKFWKGQVYKVPGDEIWRNKLRAAMVWMDEYQEIAKLTMPKLSDEFVGSLEKVRAIREKLQCKSFKWYLENVIPELWVPKIEGGLRGSIQNKRYNACVDTLGSVSDSDKIMGAYSCHHQHGTQAFILSNDGVMLAADGGLQNAVTVNDMNQMKASRFHKDNASYYIWEYSQDKELKIKNKNLCLEVDNTPSEGSPFTASLAECKAGDATQQWEFVA